MLDFKRNNKAIREYKVAPLEGFWSGEAADKSTYGWSSVIRHPIRKART